MDVIKENLIKAINRIKKDGKHRERKGENAWETELK